MKRRAVVLAIIAVAIAVGGISYAADYDPVVEGSSAGGWGEVTSAADGHTAYRIDYHAGTSGRFLVTVRNTGRWAVSVRGIEWSHPLMKLTSVRLTGPSNYAVDRPLHSVRLTRNEEVTFALHLAWQRCSGRTVRMAPGTSNIFTAVYVRTRALGVRHVKAVELRAPLVLNFPDGC